MAKKKEDQHTQVAGIGKSALTTVGMYMAVGSILAEQLEVLKRIEQVLLRMEKMGTSQPADAARIDPNRGTTYRRGKLPAPRGKYRGCC